MVINALKSTYPDWHNFLIYDFENKDLTWKKLIQDILKRANHEHLEISLAAPRLPLTSLTNKSSTNITPTSISNKNKKAYYNKYRYRHWPLSKWYKQCKQYKSDK